MIDLEDRHPKLVRGTLLCLVVFALVAVLFAALAQACFPADIDAQGHVVGMRALLIDVVGDGIAAFAAGAVASPYAGDRWRLATGVMGGVLFLVLGAATAALWQAEPVWFNLVTLSLILPFVALGAAWCSAGVRSPASRSPSA